MSDDGWEQSVGIFEKQVLMPCPGGSFLGSWQLCPTSAVNWLKASSFSSLNRKGSQMWGVGGTRTAECGQSGSLVPHKED